MEFINECFDVFESLNGLSIQNCSRLFFYDFIPVENEEQGLDGNTFLFFSNGDVIGFYPSTESFTIKIEKHKYEDVPKNATNVSNNKFWKSIIGKKILKIEFLFNKLETPYGIQFHFEDNKKMCIEYVTESEFDFDALIITSCANSSK